MLSLKNAIMPTIVFTLPRCQKFVAATRHFTNLLYPNRMALGFFTVSFPGESMTLSLVTLAQYYPSKIPIFDAKPLISEVVTLSLLCFSSANHLLSQSRRRILNVTESDIS